MTVENPRAGRIPPALIGILVATVPVVAVCAFLAGRHDRALPAEAASPEAQHARLEPVAYVATPQTPVAGGAAHFKRGHAVYDETCSACHESGVAGAPKLGDKAAWGPRIAQGFPTLVHHAVFGFQGKDGIMPPKGGGGWDDVEVARAVAWMTSRAGGSFAEPDSVPK